MSYLSESLFSDLLWASPTVTTVVEHVCVGEGRHWDSGDGEWARVRDVCVWREEEEAGCRR
jgi:hypothetical protein